MREGERERERLREDVIETCACRGGILATETIGKVVFPRAPSIGINQSGMRGCVNELFIPAYVSVCVRHRNREIHKTQRNVENKCARHFTVQIHLRKSAVTFITVHACTHTSKQTLKKGSPK